MPEPTSYSFTLFGQIPTPSPGDFGTVMLSAIALAIVIGAILGVIKVARDLFWPARSAADEYVTRREFQESLAGIKSDIESLRQSTTDKGDELKEQIKELKDYEHQSSHAIRESLNSQHVRMAVLDQKVTDQLSAAVSRLSQQVLEISKVMSRIEGRMKIAATKTQPEEEHG